MVRTAYRVNLAQQLAQCEANYWRLLRLLPDRTRRDQWQLGLTGQSGQGKAASWHTRISVVERSRYTTTLRLERADSQPLPRDWLRAPRLTLRLYEDARLAEVLAWERHRHLQPRYDYPNPAMYQQDEKAQLNRFLGEWLALCLEQGRVLEPVWQ